jgi:hypothetical protein
MKKIILILFLFAFIIVIISASINYYYTLNINYNEGELTLISSNVKQSEETIDNSLGNYSAKIYDYQGNLLNFYRFNIQNSILYDEVDENGTISGGGEIELDEVNFTLVLPYYENATKISIYDENMSKKIDIDISMYSKTYTEYKEFNIINQNVSNGEESTNQENESVNDNVTKEETFVEKISHYWWILLIILIILLAIIINYIRK